MSSTKHRFILEDHKPTPIREFKHKMPFNVGYINLLANHTLKCVYC